MVRELDWGPGETDEGGDGTWREFFRGSELIDHWFPIGSFFISFV